MDFLSLLCCPACRGNLSRPDTDRLRCTACNFTFPIVDSIPVLFPCNVAEKMGELFGRYWDSDAKAALYDTRVEGGDDIFGRHNHESEVQGLVIYYAPDKVEIVLDAGCGNGRFLETFPQGTIKVGIDASLELLRRTKRRGRGDFLVCGELEHLPFRDAVFDTVISCRVLQHLRQQQAAVEEMSRVTRDNGDVILELYNTWNPKTIYKNLRMSPRLRRALNAPFGLLFKSMSPFAPWGLEYDRYNSWFQVKRWMRRARLHGFRGRGVGFGFHKYLFDPFYITAVLGRRAPRLLEKYFQACLRAERHIGAIRPLAWTMEKFTIRGTKNAPELDVGFMSRVVARFARMLKASAAYNAAALREVAREADHRGKGQGGNAEHLQEAIGWLKRAHDATDRRGVSRAFGLGWIPYFDAKGWQPAYPETTGYIIPTMLDAAELLGDVELRTRALEMARWEVEVQMPSGAVMGGTVDRAPTPAVFNTGQVMLGWMRALAETGDVQYADALDRAARFLASVQDGDGSFKAANSLYARRSSTTYNARVGWALLLYGQSTHSAEYLRAGVKNLEYTLSQQRENGWFVNNCLTDPLAPLTHTIAYAMEGLLGGYEALQDERFLRGVTLAADEVSKNISQDGRLPGRLDANWRGTVPWVCLTGSAQLSAVLLRLASITGNMTFRDAGANLLRFVKSTQNCDSPEPGLRGGIKGSFPFDGEYGRFEILNWATKFYVDALLVEQRLADRDPGRRGV